MHVAWSIHYPYHQIEWCAKKTKKKTKKYFFSFPLQNASRVRVRLKRWQPFVDGRPRASIHQQYTSRMSSKCLPHVGKMWHQTKTRATFFESKLQIMPFDAQKINKKPKMINPTNTNLLAFLCFTKFSNAWMCVFGTSSLGQIHVLFSNWLNSFHDCAFFLRTCSLVHSECHHVPPF